jgi:hypothetical protein
MAPSRLAYALIASTVLVSNHAKAVDCKHAEILAEQEKAAFYPRQTHAVTGNGRLYLHTAPDPECRLKEVFVVPGDVLIVYSEYKGWYDVMFVNHKTGNDFTGWVKADRLKYTGNLGANEQ